MKACLYLAVFHLLLLIHITFASGQEITLAPGPTQQSGPFRVMLRLPIDGLVAGEEQQIELRIVDTSDEDPVLGSPPVIRAVVKAIILMPAMPTMPKVEEGAHPEGVPGDYGLHPTFAHGGDYLLNLHITPPKSEPFTVGFPLKVSDEIPDRKPRPKPYKIELKTEPSKIKAGEAARFRLTVWANRELRDADGRPNGKRKFEQVKTFETVHEKLMHLIVVRRDLGFLEHLHPELQSDGSFILSSFTFPTAGEYRLFTDVAPRGAGMQVLPATLKVVGDIKPSPAPLSTADRALERIVAEIRLSVANNPVLQARKTSPFVVTLRHSDDDTPITDLQPYLGSLGHLLMVHEDAQTFVHAHPDEREADNGKHGRLTFLARPPKAGLYRVWLELQRNGKMERANFIIEAKEAGHANR